jgi:hypothetical protein
MTVHLPSSFLHSKYDRDDVERLCILKPTQDILNKYANLSFAASWVNFVASWGLLSKAHRCR